MNNRVLMLMIEPAPYIVGFIKEIKSIWPGSVEVAFTGRNFTQPWDENVLQDKVLPHGFIKAAIELWLTLKYERYSLVHLAGWSNPLTFTSLLICAMRGIPITIESDTPLRSESTGWRAWVKWLFYPLLFRLPSLFLPGGTRQAAYFLNYGVTPDRIHIAHMTTDIEAIQTYQEELAPGYRDGLREEMGFTDATTVFLYVGRLERYKGILDLIAAYEDLLKYNNVTDVALLIVGEGTCRSDVDNAARNFPRITAAGRLTDKHLFDAYLKADVLVLPSPTDNWGLVVNEAMAFALPVIASNTVGCTDDLIVPGVTGLIVPAHDVVALTVTMHNLANNIEMRHKYGSSAHRHIQPWTLKREAGSVCQAWKALLR